jgi:hypothetical protein
MRHSYSSLTAAVVRRTAATVLQPCLTWQPYGQPFQHVSLGSANSRAME